METPIETETLTPVEASRAAAPEDLSKDDYITVSRLTLELVPFCEDGWQEPKVRRVQIMPGYAGYPMRVVRVCLPFVLTVDAEGDHLTLDLRRHELVKLSRRYGKKAFKCLEQEYRKKTKVTS